MEETGQAVRNFLNKIKGFVKGHLKVIIIVVAIVVIIAGAVYTVMKWTAETVTMAARAFTSSVNISSNGVITTDISAQDLWNQMLEQGYEVNKYLDSPTELLKLLQAELVTKLPDTRSNVEKPVDWNDFFNKKASEKTDDNSGRTSTEAVQGIIKFLRHDENGGQKYLTYASPSDFNSWVNEYKSTGSEDAKEKALSHFTLKKTLTKGSKKRASEGIEAVIAAAESQLGVPYSYEGSYACPKDGDNPGFNCSGLVWWAFEQAGYNVDHSQCAYDCEPPNRGMIDTVIANCGELIKDPEQLNRGDVLFYDTGDGRTSGHVAIYLGNGERIHSNEDGVHVDSNTFHSGFVGGGPLVVEDTLPTSTSTTKSTGEKSTSGTNTDKYSKKSTNESASKKISKARYTGEAEKVDGDGYTQVYTSSTGITYKGYMQNQGSYKDNHYWDYDGGSIARDGCGPASIAVLASGLRQDLDYTPGDVVSMIQEEYGNNAVSYDSYMVWAMNKLGMECELTYFPNYANPSAEDVQLLQDTLREGKVMMIGTTNPPSIFPYSSGHFIAAVDINEQGQIYIINPNGKEGNGGLGWFDAEVVARGCDSIFVTDSGSAVTTRANSDGYLGYQAVVATWTQVDKSTDFHNSPHASEAASYLGVTPGSNTTYTMSTKTIDYESMVQPYTLSFDLLWTFLVLGQSKGFVMDWADLAYGSEIEVSIYDNLTTTTTIDDWHYKEETDVKVFGRAFYIDGDVEANCSVQHDHIFGNGDTSVKQEDGQITKTVVTNQNTLTTELTKAHTWIGDYDVNYTYSKNDGNTTTSEATRDNYTVIDWTDGSIEDDPCGEIKKKINDEIVGPVNTAYQEIAERENARLMESYLQTLDAVGDMGNATPAQAVHAKSISEADVNTDGVHVQTQVNHVNIVDNISNTVDTRKYTAGTPNLKMKDEDSTDEENFVTLFNKVKYRDNKNNILSATEWLFEIMEENDKLSNQTDLIKYLLYKSTGINYGVTSYDLLAEILGANSKSASSDYNVKTDTSGGAAIKPTKEQLKLAFQSTPYSKELLGDLDKIYEVQEKYKVNGIFTAAVQIIESSAGTDLSGQYGGGSASRYSILNGHSFKGYDQKGRDEETEDFAKLISDPSGYYFGEGKYTISQIGPTYCDENWVKSIKACMADMFRAAGIKISSNDDVVDYALQFEGMLQAEIPGFLGTTLSDGSLTVQPADWCAYFASWCFDQCGLIPSKLTAGNGCADDLGRLAYGCGKYNSNGTYMPNPGDLIFFDWNFVEPDELSRIDHVAIVIDTDGSSVNYVGGNQGGGGFSSSHVTRSSMSLSSPNIVGFWNMSD